MTIDYSRLTYLYSPCVLKFLPITTEHNGIVSDYLLEYSGDENIHCFCCFKNAINNGRYFRSMERSSTNSFSLTEPADCPFANIIIHWHIIICQKYFQIADCRAKRTSVPYSADSQGHFNRTIYLQRESVAFIFFTGRCHE